MNRGLGAVLIAALAALAIATGCGDSSDGSEAALTKAEYVKQGNAICRGGINAHDDAVEAANKEKLAEDNGPLKLTSAEKEELVADTALPPVKEAIEELASLSPPTGDEKTVNSIVDGFEEAVEKTEEDPGIVFRNSDPFEPPKKEAEAYGLEDCRALG